MMTKIDPPPMRSGRISVLAMASSAIASVCKDDCPELASSSVPFSVRSVVDASKALPTQSLGLFDTVQLPAGGSLAFVGGPSYAIDWAPDGQHLAVSAHRVVRPVHQLLRLYRGAAHIQIWRVSAGGAHLAPVQMLAHAGECTWDVKWRPGSGAALLAAALGDGHVQLYLPTLNESGSVPAGEASLREGEAAHDGVRALAWSDDGRTLAVGTVQGCIELYGVRDAAGALLVHIMARVRVHEGMVSGLRWMQPYVLASVSFDGTQRVRDVRELTADIDRTSDGPGWHFAAVAPEDSVVISCSDGGYLRFTRVADLAGSAGPSDVKKTRLSTASVRTLACTSVPAEGKRKAATALLFGGAEGKLTIAAVPRPLWGGGGCQYRKSKFSSVMQWVPLQGEESLLGHPGRGGGTGHEVSELYRVKHSELELCLGFEAKEKAKPSKKSKRSYETAPGDINMCAERYDQRVCISRVALTESGDMVAAATHAGLLTVLPVPYDALFGVADGMKAAGGGPSKARLAKKKEVKVKRNRGRPRKHPPKEKKVAGEVDGNIEGRTDPNPIEVGTVDDVALNASTEKANEVGEVKRKRGRPRKHPPKKKKVTGGAGDKDGGKVVQKPVGADVADSVAFNSSTEKACEVEGVSVPLRLRLKDEVQTPAPVGPHSVAGQDEKPEVQGRSKRRRKEAARKAGYMKSRKKAKCSSSSGAAGED